MSRSESVRASIELTTEQAWEWFSGAPAQILITVALAVLARAVLNRGISTFVEQAVRRSDATREERRPRAGRVLARATGIENERNRQRTLTMGSLLRSIVTFVITVITVLTVMGIVGIPLAPLLASAGVGGVALGFGAQSLVKDFLSGVFMILEDQYGVGDVIDTGDAVGTVEEVTLRITRIRDANGVIWYIRNGEIIRVANKSQGWSTAMVDIPFSYREDTERVLEIMRTAVHGMDEDERWADRLLEEPTVLGVESISGGTVTARILAKCAPDQHWSVQREIRRRVKDALDAGDVAGPPLPPLGGPGGA